MTHATGAAGKGPAHGWSRSSLRWLPGLQTLLTYERGWLRHDLVAGLALSAFLVPVGMGYAEASGLPAIYGLYATIVPLARLWAPRSVADPRPRPGFRARTAHRRNHPSALGRRSQPGACPRRHARDPDGRVPGLDRGDPVRLRHRPAVAADPLRLPEWHRVGRDRLAAAEGVRLLGGRRRIDPAARGVRRRVGRWEGGPSCAADRIGHDRPGHHPAPAGTGRAGRARRGRLVHGRGRGLRAR